MLVGNDVRSLMKNPEPLAKTKPSADGEAVTTRTTACS